MIHSKSKRKKTGFIVTYYLCRPCNTEHSRKYASTSNGRQKIREAVKRSSKKLVYKQKARIKVYEALKQKTLTKALRCLSCGQRKKLDGHHEDYLKPFEVIWLCRQCHADLHKNQTLLT